MNQTINPFHIILLLFVFVIYQHQKKITKKGKIDKTDLIRNNLTHFHISPIFQIVLSLIPVYILLTHQNTTSCVLESIFIMLTYVLSIKTLQNIINPRLNGNINFNISFVSIILLNSIYNNIIQKEYTKHVYFYLLVLLVVSLKNNEDETTTSITNDIILSHIIFFLNK